MNPILPVLDGVLLVNKPSDWTSHDVCAFVRKRFKIKKVGHAGTLDPMATGLLVLLLGNDTKKSMEYSGADKEYAGVMELGIKTDSHDRTGRVLQTGNAAGVTLDKIRAQAQHFMGEILQVPPMVSALKHKGVRLYDLARKGVEVPREGRKINVFDWTFQKQEGPLVHFSTHVSKGTYVRTLVNDLGEALGCYATLNELCRTRSGEFKLEDALTIDQLKEWTAPQLRDHVYSLRSHYANLQKN